MVRIQYQMWFFLLLLCSCVLAQQAVELTKIYTSTNGANWNNKGGWLNGDPCVDHWYGVTCDVNASVVAIDLTDNHLVGTLPASLDVPTLARLRLSNNELLTGDIPNYSNMKFTEIFLNNTALNGPFPDWFSQVPTLESIYLSGANFSGPFPLSWCSMTQLKSLNLGQQKLTGGLPDCIGNMTSLTYLDIQDAPLGGQIPDSIANLQNLLYLTLVNTELSGSLPEALSSLGSLLELRLKGNDYSGIIPASYESMSSVVYLSLASNYLTGTIPQWLSRADIIYIDLRCNDFVGPLPEWLKTEPDTNVLFTCNNITSAQLPSWCFSGAHCGNTGCEGTRCDVPPDPADQPPNKAVIIALACFLALLLIGNVMLMVFLIRRKCMRYDHTAEMKPILSPKSRIRNDTRRERESEYH